MAESFSKKENSKKKAKKKQEKQLRREDRKTNNNKGKELDDMIVYVDINGNFTSTPPHLQDREGDLLKAQQAKEAEEVDTIAIGTVTYFSEKGFGFITQEDNQDNVFFHHGDLNTAIKKHDKVSFKKESTHKGYKAYDINKVNN